MNMKPSIVKLQQLECFIYGNILKTGWAASSRTPFSRTNKWSAMFVIVFCFSSALCS